MTETRRSGMPPHDDPCHDHTCHADPCDDHTCHDASCQDGSGGCGPGRDTPDRDGSCHDASDREQDAADREHRGLPAISAHDRIASVKQDLTASLLQAASRASADERRGLLDDVVVLHIDLADGIARRYAGRGIELDDLIQVARLALCKAARGYQVGRGPSFEAYAFPTVQGEVKRHFRDTGWAVRPPRRLQELRARIDPAIEALRRATSQEPTEEAIAAALGVEPAELQQARLCSAAYRTDTLDDAQHDSGLRHLAVDGGFDRFDDSLTLRAAVAGLEPRDRSIIRMRFVEERTQSDIAARIGVSQMQVSRLIARILHRLRCSLTEAPSARAG